MAVYNFNNGFNGQTPPDSSYSWNGSDNNGNGGGGFKTALIIMSVILVTVFVVFGVIMMRNGDNANGNSSNQSSSAVSQNESEGSGSNEFSRDPDMTIPDFSIADDAVIDMATDYSKIYAECAPSCCTVRVSVGGRPYSIGSGFVIDSEGGYIATNHHVIEDADEITVAFYNGNEYTAQLVGSDPITDIAVLHVDVKDLPAVSFGDSGKLNIGEYVVAIGTPYDESLAGTMTCGIISGIARDIDITNSSGKVVKTMTLIQTDCSINPGNSGGPLIDMSGNVIGITSLKIADEQFEGIGFAIPITSAVDIFKKLIAGEPITDSDIASASPQIGITVYDVDDGLAYFRVTPRCEYPQGVLIADIEITSSAYAAGLSRYDVITEFGGVTVTNRDDLTSALANYRAGDSVKVKVFRFNRTLTGGTYETIEFKLDAAE
ncbi:MAG: trypsin-like serine protease [Ruminococcaceae bacterium]|nr:trypsin-like serine protease [Oscillospiraceae bacterium]